MLKDWRLLGIREVFSCRLFKLKVKEFLSPRTGKPHEFYQIETRDWVGIIPLLNEEVILVRQFRHGSEEMSLEIPGGIVDEDDPLQAALRELEEETGFKAKRIELLGVLKPQPALFNNRFYVFLARELEKVGDPLPEETEQIELVKMPLSQVLKDMASGKIDHALVLAAFELLRLRYPELLT
jgi:8-oxo-dGTP pyrophosphatase MutT (NUDIX family)